MPEVKDKEGKPIHVGDIVSGKIRGGKHVGEVEAIVTNEKEAAEKGVKNPPKVLIVDQHGILNRKERPANWKDTMSAGIQNRWFMGRIQSNKKQLERWIHPQNSAFL